MGRDYIIRYWNSARHKCSFLGIPKCGSSSVRSALNIDPQEDWTLTPVYNFTFTMVRNPVPRAVSMYYEMLRQRPHCKRLTNFDTFLRSLQIEGFWNEHLWPMSDYYRPVKTFFRLEHKEDFETVFDVTFPKVNATHQTKLIPTDTQVAVIKEIYQEDYNFFMY